VGPVAIVVGVDGSDTSLRALAYAVGAARRMEGRVVVGFVHPHARASAALGVSAGVVDAALTAAAEVEDAACDVVATAVETARDECGVAIELRHLQGTPAEALARLADAEAADLVVVGASRHPANPVHASVARRLNRHIAWPLTVVP
jgi:nucleotide-binding universal stress UspA family protein